MSFHLFKKKTPNRPDMMFLFFMFYHCIQVYSKGHNLKYAYTNAFGK